MFERPNRGERAVIVSINFRDPHFDAATEEIKLLSTSAGANVVDVVLGKRDRPDASTFIGKGKVEELADRVLEQQADLVIFNHDLSAGQARNLESRLNTRVLDRTGLILDIFAQRARSHEGKLQVELAQLEHLASRLVRGWTHLERQKGGIGLRGPGETQLETDRRLLGKRVKLLKERLVKVRQQRITQRAARERNDVFRVSLIGYTNAGKSTLFNRLTRAEAYVADKLFATLDTTTRRLKLGDARAAVVSDTVGFVRDLPHELVDAFRSTLEETREADLLLHVVDAASTEKDLQIQAVNSVLAEVGAERVPQLLVFNKVDLAPQSAPGVERDEYGKLAAVRLSALTGIGMADLIAAIGELIDQRHHPSQPDTKPTDSCDAPSHLTPV